MKSGDNERSRHYDSVPGAKVASLMIVSVPSLGAGMNSASAAQGWSADILASSTAAIGLDLFSRGPRPGTTRMTSMSITSMAGYYLCNPSYPGTRISINVVL